jgi:PAS domain S-box-containing protein
MVAPDDDLNLLLSQLDCGILLLSSELTLVRFNQVLAKVWGMLPIWLNQCPSLADILHEIIEQGYWSRQQCEAFYQTVVRLKPEATVYQLIEQTDGRILDIKITATGDGRWLLLVRCRADPVMEPEYQNSSEVVSFPGGIQRPASTDDSEVYIRQLTENIEEVFWIANPAMTRIMYASPAFEKIWGYSLETLYQEPSRWMESIHPDDCDRLQIPLDQDEFTTREYRIYRPDGSIRWIRDRIFPIRNRMGQLCRLTGISEDITNQKSRETRLHLLESVVVNANDSIIVTDSYQPPNVGPFIVYVNPAFTRMTGYQPEEVLGKTPRLLQGPRTDRTVLASIREALNRWEPIMVELINYRKDRSEFWVELSIVPVLDTDGRCMHWIAIQRDITQRKQLEAELLKTLEKERQLGELKSRFVTNTSHEFRTPLSIILSAAELLEHYGHAWSRNEQVEQLQLIQSTVQHMTDLLEDILLIGKAEGEEMAVTASEIDLEIFCQNLVRELQKGIGKGHRLQIHLGCKLGNVWLDEKLLRQTLSNLLSNAIKYSPPGSLITLEIGCDDQHVTFQVIDQGIGIPTGDQAQVFEFFRRARNVGVVPGSGLGLAIAKHCVEAQHGTLSFTSTEGQGSTFTVTLPLSLIQD